MNIKQFYKEVQEGTMYHEVTDYPKTYYKEYEDYNGGVTVITIYDELKAELKRVPTHTEFINHGVKRIKGFFTDPKKLKNGKDRWLPIYKNGGRKWHNFVWTQRLEEAVTWRVARSYKSMVAEDTTKLMLEYMFPNHLVLADNNLDLVLGSDLTVVNKDTKDVYYLHVLLDNHNSDRTLVTKGKRQGYLWVNGEKHTFDRDFNEAHIKIAYDNVSTDKTTIINGIPFMHAKYIKQQLRNATPEHFDSSQLKRFSEWYKAIQQ